MGCLVLLGDPLGGAASGAEIATRLTGATQVELTGYLAIFATAALLVAAAQLATQLRGTLGWVAGAAGAATATLLATYYGSLAAGSITPRETEVLLELAQGKPNAEIAAALYLGEGTVKTHIAALLRKLQVQPGTNA